MIINMTANVVACEFFSIGILWCTQSLIACLLLYTNFHHNLSQTVLRETLPFNQTNSVYMYVHVDVEFHMKL